MTILQYVKSFFLFGNPISIFKFIRSFSRLNEITGRDGFNPFHAKKEFNEFQRQEEVILYGYHLTTYQRNTQDTLFQQIAKERDVHDIFLGRYIGKEGILSASLFIETLLFFLSAIAITYSSIIFIAFSCAAIIYPAYLTNTPFIIAITLCLNGYIVFQFYFLIFSTSRTFLMNRKSLRKILN